MCYKATCLDLNGIHLACLSGDNGAGKSAIFDSITWALWGEARASADDLVAQSEVEMQVDLEFYCGSQLYRVVRHRSKKGAGRTELNFFIQHEDGWTRLTRSNVRATQENIIEVVRMRYETFINSAFLKQGRADEFTLKTARERKQVLAEILGLNAFDELEKKAKEEVKKAEAELKKTSDKLDEIRKELDNRPKYEIQKKEAERVLEEVQQQLKEQNDLLLVLHTGENVLKTKEKELNNQGVTLESLKKKLKNSEIKRHNAQKVLDESLALITRRAEIETGHSELQKTKLELDDFNEKAGKNLAFEKRAMELEKVISGQRMAIEARLKSNSQSLEEYRKQGAALGSLETELAGLKQEMERAADLSEEYDQKKAEGQLIETNIKVTESNLSRLNRELDEIEAKAKRLPKPGEICDRCGTVLSEEACNTTIEQFREEYRARQKEVKETQKAVLELKSNQQELMNVVKRLEKTAAERLRLERLSGIKEQQLRQAREAENNQARQQALVELCNKELENRNYARAEQQALAELKREIAALNYDKAFHDKIKTRYTELGQFEELFKKLYYAQQDSERARQELEAATTETRSLKEEQLEIEQNLEELKAELAGLQQLRLRIEAEAKKLQTVQDQEKSINRQLSAAEVDLKRLDKLEEGQKEEKKKHFTAAQSKEIYNELAEAFGKKGIQALVIDTVLPELEEEANDLLGKMTDGRMSVRFDTQRDSRKGEPIETLDLRISDEQGTRPYELFSGGEAFRVNFAVRIALSKLLARRSGAQLRTLIIDEGFGSQDGQGRERLVEAILGIEQDFERVLVITHIQELKDVFPIRIDVVKSLNGSQIMVN